MGGGGGGSRVVRAQDPSSSQGPAPPASVREGGWGDAGAPPMALSRPRSLQGPQWRSVEEEFPHIYAHGYVLKEVCRDCTSFVADVVRSSRKSVDALNTPRRARQTQSLYIPNTWTLDLK